MEDSINNLYGNPLRVEKIIEDLKKIKQQESPAALIKENQLLISQINQFNGVSNYLKYVRKIIENPPILQIKNIQECLNYVNSIQENFLKNTVLLQSFNTYYDTDFSEDDISQACNEVDTILRNAPEDEKESILKEVKKTVKNPISLKDICLAIKSHAPSKETLIYLTFAFGLLNKIYDFAEKIYNPFF